MHRLSLAFQHWIKMKMETDPFWQHGAEVIFSGPDVPGEGEHKVMDFIREERAKNPEYVPGKERHCLYGLDADLIMLGLVTHEPYFVLLREKMVSREAAMSIRKRGDKQGKSGAPVRTQKLVKYDFDDFECLEITTLRKMLHMHYRHLEADIHLLKSHSSVPTSSTPSAAAGGEKVGKEKAPSTKTRSKLVGDGATPLMSRGLIEELMDKTPTSWQQDFDIERIVDDFVFM